MDLDALSPWTAALAAVVVIVLWEAVRGWLPALVTAVRLVRARRAPSLAAHREHLLRAAGREIEPVPTAGDLTHHDRVVVVGAGASALLRSLPAAWARDPGWRRLPVPVLVAAAGRALADEVAAAGPFARRGLAAGRLVVLVDGLDAVDPADRQRAARAVRSFADRHPGCRMVVACRTAAAATALGPDFAAVAPVRPLDDQRVRRYLHAVDPTSAERRMAALVADPAALRLVREPALLRAYARLAPDEVPRSRADLVDTTEAEALRAEPDALLARHAADPAATRDTVIAWCASARRPGPVIAALDPVLAAECLAEAGKVEAGVVDAVTERARALLAGGRDPAATRALGALAADPRQRGQVVLAFLIAAAQDGNPVARQALAATGLPRAVRVLADQLPDTADALAVMGDQAVPALAPRLDRDTGAGVVVDVLAAIGTPAAAQALVPLLWRDGQIATGVAWRLAALLADPLVAATLTTDRLEDDPGRWLPFHDPDRPGLTTIAARVIDLCASSAPPADLGRVDPRVGLALVLFADADSALVPGLRRPPPRRSREVLWADLATPSRDPGFAGTLPHRALALAFGLAVIAEVLFLDPGLPFALAGVVELVAVLFWRRAALPALGAHLVSVFLLLVPDDPVSAVVVPVAGAAVLALVVDVGARVHKAARNPLRRVLRHAGEQRVGDQRVGRQQSAPTAR
ncbi:NACHT domain-containing protein [Actinokineospora pegani]|uniref:hypothetical protein n=1 Tax=Actinokineospora pegani TaxID=2654637 RepID=UPI0012E99821|nr:hypothetical protein [Actinokineospora pegani]